MLPLEVSEGGKLAWQMEGGQQWDPGLAFTFGVNACGFSHGICGVGQRVGKTRAIASFSAPSPRAPERTGLTKERSIALM